jgi:hypothetical protein
MGTGIEPWNGRIEYVEEASYGALPYSSTMGWIGDVRSFEVKVKKDKDTRHRLAARGATNKRKPSSVKEGMEHYSVKMEWAPQASSAIYDYMNFVSTLIGTSTGIADTKRSLVLNAVAKEGTVEGPVLGAVDNYFQAKGSVGEDIIFEAELLAQDWDPSAPLSVTSDLSGAVESFEEAAEASGEVLDWLDSEVVLSGTTQDMLTDWEFKIDNKAYDKGRLNGSALPAGVYQKPAIVTGKLVYDLDDTVELLRLKANSSFTLAIKIGDKTWTFTGCEWVDTGMPIDPNDELVQIELPFIATNVTVA